MSEESTCPLSRVSWEAHRQADWPKGMSPRELCEATPINGIDIPRVKSVLAEHHRTFLKISKIFTNGLSVQDYPYYDLNVPLHLLVRTICRWHEYLTKIRVHAGYIYASFGDHLYIAAEID